LSEDSRHNITVLSMLPVARSCAVGWNATDETPRLCPARVATREGGKGEHTPAGDQSQQGLYGGGDRGLRELGQQWRGVDTAKEARL
jgi:hypothetical protein